MRPLPREASQNDIPRNHAIIAGNFIGKLERLRIERDRKCGGVAAEQRSSPFPQDGLRRILPGYRKSGKLNESLANPSPVAENPGGHPGTLDEIKRPDLVDWTCPIQRPS